MVKLAVRTALTGILLLSGCAAQVGFQNAQQRQAALAAFQTGQAQLTCLSGQCLGAWNTTRPVVAQMASAGSWVDVAADVLAANYDQDLGWYYLGSAASALGYRPAARIYFEHAIRNSMAGGLQTCLPLTCDGWNLPADARTALASLEPIPARVVRRRVAPRRVTPASASPNWVAPTTNSASSGSAPAGWVSPVTSGGSAAPSSGGWVAPVQSHQ